MGYLDYSFTLDLRYSQSQISIPAVLNDTYRKFCISLSDGGKPYFIEDGCLAMFTLKRPSGSVLTQFCEIQHNTTIVYHAIASTFAEVGINDCEITIYGADKNQITSPKFIIVVSERVLSSDDLDLSDDEKYAIDSMMQEEVIRRNNEIDRLNREADRDSAEDKRVKAEEERVKAEEERAKNRINPELLEILKNAFGFTDIDWYDNDNPIHLYTRDKILIETDFEPIKLCQDGESSLELSTNGLDIQTMYGSLNINDGDCALYANNYLLLEAGTSDDEDAVATLQSYRKARLYSYYNGVEVSVDNDGITFSSDSEGESVTFTVAELKALKSGGGGNLGDIDTALDAIIAIQESLMGVSE